MKGAVETMIGAVIIALMAVLSTAYITACLNTQRAQNYHAAVVGEIEAADFADAVIESCKDKAKENKFTDLAVQKISTISGRSCAKVTLTYEYTVPLLNLFLEHRITGYAR